MNVASCSEDCTIVEGTMVVCNPPGNKVKSYRSGIEKTEVTPNSLHDQLSLIGMIRLLRSKVERVILSSPDKYRNTYRASMDLHPHSNIQVHGNQQLSSQFFL